MTETTVMKRMPGNDWDTKMTRMTKITREAQG